MPAFLFKAAAKKLSEAAATVQGVQRQP